MYQVLAFYRIYSNNIIMQNLINTRKLASGTNLNVATDNLYQKTARK